MKHHPYNLKGSTLEVFSALYCLTRKRAFLGTYMDLASWIEIEPKTLRRALKVLNEKDLVSIDKSESGFDRYEFQAHHIKGYPLPDYRYSGKRSYTSAPIIDSQNLEEYQNEIEATGGVIDPTKGQNVSTQGQNVPPKGQNVPLIKESNKENNNYNIYNNNIYNKEKKQHTNVCVVKKEDGQAVTHTKKIVKTYHFEPYPTTEEEVIQYAKENYPTISIEVVKDFFNHYNGNGWRYSKNGRVRNWKSELFAYDQRRMKFEKASAAKAIAKVQSGVSPEVLAIEEQMREQRRKEREQADREANTPEALAARDAFFEKFGKNSRH